MNYKNFIQTKVSQKTLWVIGALVVALLIFQAGIFVGYRKASFSYGSGDNFHRMFGSPERPGMIGRKGMMGFEGMIGREGMMGPNFGGFTSAYGTTGTIVKISLPTIVVAGTDKVEKIITTDSKTIVRSFRNEIKPTDLKVGDSVIIIGAPNTSAQIEAKLIRVLPSPLAPSTTE